MPRAPIQVRKVANRALGRLETTWTIVCQRCVTPVPVSRTKSMDSRRRQELDRNRDWCRAANFQCKAVDNSCELRPNALSDSGWAIAAWADGANEVTSGKQIVVQAERGISTICRFLVKPAHFD